MPEDGTDELLSEGTDGGGQWGALAAVGAMSICCLGVLALAGGAAVMGGTAAGSTAATGVIGGLTGLLVTALATALPLFVIGLFVRHRTHNS
jgi:hypothetical protein